MQWTPISEPLSHAESHYEVVVVGSGYGAGVAASRLARAGRNVAVLERGREIAPGDYPKAPGTAMAEMQVTLSKTGDRIGNADSLYDFRVGDDVNVLLGCGLGGTSLINANVAIEPDTRIFRHWPKPFRDNPDLLKPFYKRARIMLGSKPYPEGKTVPKLEALKKSAEGMGAPFWRPDINVTFDAGYNAAGVWQEACTDCGDCVSGCNYGAKNTVLMNYLPDAAKKGAKIFTGAHVLSLGRDVKTWVVRVKPTDSKSSSDIDEIEIKADFVVLGAGTLGSTEILLKSAKEIGFSDRLGKGFSTNGDVWAFGYNANMPVAPDDDERLPTYCVGAGPHTVTAGPTPPGEAKYRPGPCITGLLDLRDPDKPVEAGLIIEEGAMPGALAMAYAAAFPMMDALLGDPFRFGDTGQRLMDMQKLAGDIQADPLGLAHRAYDGPVSRTLPFLVMSHDASDGVLTLENDTVTVDWKRAGYEQAFFNDAKALRDASDAIQAEYMPNPLWQDAFGNRLVAVHPLGGCSMGDSHESGVINDACQVFDGKGGLHDGLFVVDGAAIPRSIGVNPHLTITAVAERAMSCLIDAKKWPYDDTPAKDDLADLGPPPGIPVDILDMLDSAIAGIEQIKQAIDNQMWELARMMLMGVWRNVLSTYETYKDKLHGLFQPPDLATFIGKLGDPDPQRDIVGPILGEMLDVLRPIRDALERGDFAKIQDIAETKLGDFSPPVCFKETMTGRVVKSGLDDPPSPFDPYEAAGDGPANAVFTGTVKAPALKTAITPGKSGAEIKDATFECDALGGSFDVQKGHFDFLIPDPARIESWNMIYTGELTKDDAPDPLFFRGKKTLERREGSHWWKDLTDLSVDIAEDPKFEKIVARGMLHVEFEEVIKQAKNLKIEYTALELFTALSESHTALKTAFDDNPHDLLNVVKDLGFRTGCVKGVLLALSYTQDYKDAPQALAAAYKAQVFARMGGLVLRTYGGLFSYMSDFPAIEAGPDIAPDPTLPDPEVHYPETEPNLYLKLTRYRRPIEGKHKGPVMLAGGFGTKASAFALSTVNTNLVKVLTDADYDVWLFDYRGSGAIKASQKPFNLDDVATKDWPAAIDMVTARTGAKDVQLLVHCVGSMTAFMSVMAGEDRVRSILCSQLGPHAITNWFNFAKGDSHMASYLAHGLPEAFWPVLDAMQVPKDVAEIAKHGCPVIDPRSSPKADPSPTDTSIGPISEVETAAAIDALVYNVPSFAPVPCLSPTCHRINAIFGPSYLHDNLNEATHNAIRHMFGPVSSTSGIQIGKIFETGHVISDDCSIDYFAKPERLQIPIHFIAGGRNAEMLPEATLRTLHWLQNVNPKAAEKGLYTRKVYPDYGHMDCFIGQNAADDIFDDLVSVLDQVK